jgi:hemerythrin HHE cation binding domain-containing protein
VWEDTVTMGKIRDHMSRDHARLDALLRRSVADPARIDRAAFQEFRAGLLRHIGMEEKLLFPAAARAAGGTPLPLAERLRADHGRLAALLVPTPTHALAAQIAELLATHNALEEGEEGVYAQCERLAADQIDEIVARLAAAPAVRTAPHRDP